MHVSLRIETVAQKLNVLFRKNQKKPLGYFVNLKIQPNEELTVYDHAIKVIENGKQAKVEIIGHKSDFEF